MMVKHPLRHSLHLSNQLNVLYLHLEWTGLKPEDMVLKKEVGGVDQQLIRDNNYCQNSVRTELYINVFDHKISFYRKIF